MKRILITGGAGFIGSHTADALLKKGYEVRILDLLDPQIHGTTSEFPTYLDPTIECIRGDVRVLSDVVQALDGVDAVYHFAALTGVGQSMYDIRDYVQTNSDGTATLLEAIVKQKRSVKRLILASSRAVYGEGSHECSAHGEVTPAPRKRSDLAKGAFGVFCPQCGAEMSAVPTREERSLSPASIYALTKQHQEDYCRYAAETFDLPVTVLRYFNVYGSRQSLNNPYTGVVSIFYNRIMADKAVSLYEHGLPIRDFVHVNDVVQANLRALETDTGQFGCFNVGTGKRTTIIDIVEALAQAVGRHAQTEDRGEFRVGDIHACYADLARIHAVLGYKPQTPLRDGMVEFSGWARKQASTDQYEKTVDELRQFGLFGRADDKQP